MPLNHNITYKPASMSEAQQLTDLMIACDIAEFGMPDIVIEDTIDILNSFPIETNTWVARIDEQIVGFAFIDPSNDGKMISYGYVHPQHKGQGIGSQLISFVERRAREIAEQNPENTWRLANVVPALNEDAVAMLEARGYVFQRLYRRMHIELVQKPNEPKVSYEGVSLRPYDPSIDEKIVYELYKESFEDTRGSIQSYEDWAKEKSGDHFDKSLWFVACDGDRPAGFIVSKNFSDHVFVDLLGVLRTSRKKGIGLALLERVFYETHLKGIHSVLLSVDGNSLTQANKLYERAGMKAIFETALFDKPC